LLRDFLRENPVANQPKNNSQKGRTSAKKK